ncbi:MAG TPA: LON peptidase substrate-binding domain-containing protein [Polymorphobacter sp.]|nr:LON peptidase substrate-binding domain-containing protein [Polymorphobacter sp.]
MTDIDALPEVIPVFPLAGAVLLPRGVMPLNIFEPRYLKMVRDAVAGTKLIGMVQPRVAKARSTQPPALFDIGCVGRITEFEETGDGRLLIELTGLRRFKVAREIDVVTPYRQVVADYEGFDADAAEPVAVNAAARAALEETLRTYLDANGLSADWEAVTGADDESLVITLAAVCPFEPVEKQALLEAPDLPSRAATLTALMTFAQGFGTTRGGDGPGVQ